MIGALVGKVYSKKSDSVLIMVSGVGYLVFVSGQLLQQVNINQELSVFTHTHVRDDALQLFGFATNQELWLFELLLSVSGIGPKTALAVIDRGVGPIQSAIMSADVAFFTTIPRLGRKNAQKIIIELKTKLGSVADLDLQADTEGEELINALKSMGFSRAEILIAIDNLPKEITTLPEKLKAVLKLLSKSKP